MMFHITSRGITIQVNMLEAKNQLSKLVKAALSGEEIIIASHGQPQVRLVPCRTPPGLRHWGALAGQNTDIDTAFSPQTDAEILNLFTGKS